MDILILGNGFDIAHGLPTQYTDFLKYCRCYNPDEPVSKSEDLNTEFNAFINSNNWYKYFIETVDSAPQTWIDFEKVIAGVVNYFDPVDVYHLSLQEQRIIREVFNPENYYDIKTTSFINYIYLELRELARAFEIYCLRVNKIAIPVKIRPEAYERLGHPRIISFNYTNTYERLYGISDNRCCYIHGKAQEDWRKTNIIFGIDDNLPAGKESSNFKWVKFKKYYQRIIFKTGSQYNDWFPMKANEQFQNFLMNKPTIHIIGHSLDKTDYDVLYDIFSNPQNKIIVYYHSPEAFEDKVQKVIQLLAYKGLNGRDELIRRVHGNRWSIKFVDQYDADEGLFERPISISAAVEKEQPKQSTFRRR